MHNITPTIAIKLAQILQTEPEDALNHLIAREIFQNMHEIAHLSTNDIARICNVSKTTVIRFCRHLGYETFAEFKEALLMSTSDIRQKYPSKIEDTISFGMDYFNHIVRNIEWMKQHLDFSLLQTMAQDIITHEHIYLLGNAHSGSSANNLMFSLLQMGKQVSTIHREQIQIIDHLRPNSMMIIISNYGSFFNMLTMSDCFKNKPEKTVIYLLTCNASLSCPSGIDHIILCSEDTGLTGGNVSIDMVLNLLLQYYKPLSLYTK